MKQNTTLSASNHVKSKRRSGSNGVMPGQSKKHRVKEAQQSQKRG